MLWSDCIIEKQVALLGKDLGALAKDSFGDAYLIACAEVVVLVILMLVQGTLAHTCGKKRSGTGPVPSLEGQTWLAMFRLEWRLFTLVLSWFLFYMVYVLCFDLQLKNFLQNATQNFTSWVLVWIYAALVAPEPRTTIRSEGREYRLILVRGWGLVFVAATVLEALSGHQLHVMQGRPEILHAPFNLFAGIAQGLVLFLIIGRLDDSALWDHVRPEKRLNTGKLSFWPGWMRVLLVSGYAYAALQSTYPVLDQADLFYLEPWIIGLAFLLKVLLVLLFRILLKRKQADRPCAMEHLLYETDRFHTEELKSYERGFLRRHVNPNHRRHHGDDPYLGIEYMRMNEHKRKVFGISEDQDGLWITDVYPGSPAMKAGLRAGDYLTHVRHQPIGTGTGLSEAQEGSKAGEDMRVVFCRPDVGSRVNKSPLDAPPVALQGLAYVHSTMYSKLPHRRIARYSRPAFGFTVLHNDPTYGVRVDMRKEGSTAPHLAVVEALHRVLYDETHSVPDMSGFRLLRERLMPGEPLKLYLRGEGWAPLLLHGPMQAGATARWRLDYQVAAEGAAPVPSSLDNVEAEKVLKRVRKRYPDRFSATANFLLPPESSSEWSSSEDKGLLFAFDEKLELVFEYYFSTGLAHLSQWPVWRKVTAGTVYLFVGQPPSPVKDQFGRLVHKCCGGTMHVVQLHRSTASNQ